MPWRESRTQYQYWVKYKHLGRVRRFAAWRRVIEWIDPDEEETSNNPYSDYRKVEDMKRKAQVEAKAKGKYVPPSEPFLKAYPEILRYMADSWYDDGKAREVSTLSITLVGSGVAIKLSDPDERATAFTDASTLAGALEALEGALGAGKDPFRPWPRNFGKKTS